MSASKCFARGCREGFALQFNLFGVGKEPVLAGVGYGGFPQHLEPRSEAPLNDHDGSLEARLPSPGAGGITFNRSG
jgi:hypothetical protein